MSRKSKRCIVCNRTLKLDPYRSANIPTDWKPSADNLPCKYGYRGNNLVCTSYCGFTLAIRLVLSVPGILDLLPDKWRYNGQGNDGLTDIKSSSKL
jgi:hypothetical protein